MIALYHNTYVDRQRSYNNVTANEWRRQPKLDILTCYTL